MNAKRLGMAAAFVLIAFASCTTSTNLNVSPAADRENSLKLCPDAPISLTVYNYYADHSVADVQVIAARDELQEICEFTWNDLGAQARDLSDLELSKRSVTVLSFDGGRTVWVYRLAGFGKGIALRLSSGETYFVPNHDIQPYYAPIAAPIDRRLVPNP